MDLSSLSKAWRVSPRRRLTLCADSFIPSLLSAADSPSAALAAYTRAHSDDDPLGIADAHAYRSEADAAFACLDRAYLQKESGLYWLKGDTLLRNLEGDPRYKAFLRRMNLPE